MCKFLKLQQTSQILKNNKYMQLRLRLLYSQFTVVELPNVISFSFYCSKGPVKRKSQSNLQDYKVEEKK